MASTDPEPLRVEAHEDGAVVRIRAAPGASKERVVGRLGDALKVAVAAPPEQGKANRRIVEVLARALALPPRRLEIVSGTAARDKRLLVKGVSREELLRLLQSLLAP